MGGGGLGHTERNVGARKTAGGVAESRAGSGARARGGGGGRRRGSLEALGPSGVGLRGELLRGDPLLRQLRGSAAVLPLRRDLGPIVCGSGGLEI